MKTNSTMKTTWHYFIRIFVTLWCLSEECFSHRQFFLVQHVTNQWISTEYRHSLYIYGYNLWLFMFQDNSKVQITQKLLHYSMRIFVQCGLTCPWKQCGTFLQVFQSHRGVHLKMVSPIGSYIQYTECNKLKDHNWIQAFPAYTAKICDFYIQNTFLMFTSKKLLHQFMRIFQSVGQIAQENSVGAFYKECYHILRSI